MKLKIATIFLTIIRVNYHFLTRKKEVIVFCSHFHKDHFNPVIFEILDDMGMTYQAILAKDIRKRKHLSDMRSHMFIMIRLIIWIMALKSIHCYLTIVV